MKAAILAGGDMAFEYTPLERLARPTAPSTSTIQENRMSACPICSSDAIGPLFNAENVPVFCNVQWSDKAQALRAPRSRLELHVCFECGHAFNAAFDPGLVDYSPAYDNSQHFSSTFQAYAKRLVDRLVTTYNLNDVSVVDIGCGRGDLLSLLARRGGNRGFGFDPSFDPSAGSLSAIGVDISQQYFTREHATDISPALVCCRHVLEHVFDPIKFLSAMRETLSVDRAPILYLEVPNGEHQLRNAGIWDYIYEHYSYFSRHSLQIALRKAGFEILRIEEDFGGGFLCADVRPSHASTVVRRTADPQKSGDDFRHSSDGLRRKLAHWNDWAAALRDAGRSATVWGAGSKGVMFVNLLGLQAPDPIEFVIDQNPGKHGRYLACCGLVVSGPDRLTESSVDELVVMNEIYLPEIRDRLAVMGVDPYVVSA